MLQIAFCASSLTSKRNLRLLVHVQITPPCKHTNHVPGSACLMGIQTLNYNVETFFIANTTFLSKSSSAWTCQMVTNVEFVTINDLKLSHHTFVINELKLHSYKNITECIYIFKTKQILKTNCLWNRHQTVQILLLPWLLSHYWNKNGSVQTA